MEQKSIEAIQTTHPKLRYILSKIYNECVKSTPNGVHPYIDEVYRSFKRSDQLYQQGRTTPGEIVTYAKGGTSYHNYGLAADLHLIINNKDVWLEEKSLTDSNWKIILDIFQKNGFNWGGYFPTDKEDYPHFEYKGFGTVNQLLTKYNAGDTFVDSNGLTYVNL